MKKTALFAALLALSQAPLRADVPLFINYQGKVYDSTGLPLGATGTASAPVAAPVNRKILFRFYDAVTGGNRLWTEEQTVTISLGEFSVLLGQGIGATGTASGESRPAIDTVFTSGTTGRYLEITVDNGDNTINASDGAITPRQQITTTAFTFRARTADGVASDSDLALTPLTGTATNNGLGWYGSGRLFAGAAIDGPVLYGNAGGALGSNTNNTYLTALRWTAAGQVGIGSTSLAGAAATSKLVIQGDDATTPAQQLVIRGDADSNKRLMLGYNTTLNQATLTSYSAASTAANLILNSNGGNVGIGTTAPSAALSVAGAITATGTITGGSFSTVGAITTSAGSVGIGTTAPTNRLSVEAPASAQTATGTATVAKAIAHIGASDSHTYFGSYDGTNSYGNWIQSMRSWDTATFPLALNPNGGNVGIGVSNPGYKLDVSGAAHVSQNLTLDGNLAMAAEQYISGKNIAGGSEAAFWPRAANGTYINYGTSGFYIRNNDSTNTMVMTADNKVQIGTGTSSGRLNIGTATATYTSYGRLTNNGASPDNTTITNGNLSINADGDIYSQTVYVRSDLRTKTALKLTDSVKDLGTLMGIQITDYHLKDTIANGSNPQKKVIAQQVEKVYPQAVSLQKGVVPDIFKKATVQDGWVMLATDLAVGDRVRLISEKGESLEEVLEVRRDAFRTTLKSEEAKTFVYGREVKDFRSVDYDAIAMLNVSATQQLKREKDAEIQALREATTAEMKALRGENAALRRALAAQEQSLEARLIALEQRLSKSGAPEAVAIKAARSAP